MEIEEVGKELSEKELEKQEFYTTMAKLEDRHMLETVLKSEEWKVLRRVWKDNRDAMVEKLTTIDPTDIEGIRRCQTMIDFYDNVLPRSIEEYRNRGREAFETAKEQGWMDRIATYLKTI